MTLDEQLQQSLGALSDRLRDEISRAVDATRVEVAAHADQARHVAVEEASTRAREEARAAAQVEIDRLELALQDMSVASESRERRRAADVAACERLVNAFRDIDQAPNLTDILDALVDCARREAPRVGLLLARNGELRGWRFNGFGLAADPARSVVVRADASGIVGDALRTGLPAFSDGSGPPAAPAFAELPDGRESLAVPLIVSGDVAAVLYADQGGDDEITAGSSTLKWADTLELFARHAARCVEAATAIRAVRAMTDSPEIPDSAASQARAADATRPAGAIAAPPPPDAHEQHMSASS